MNFMGGFGGGQYGGQDPYTARRQKSQQNYAPQENYVDLKHLNDDRYCSKITYMMVELRHHY